MRLLTAITALFLIVSFSAQAQEAKTTKIHIHLTSANDIKLDDARKRAEKDLKLYLSTHGMKPRQLTWQKDGTLLLELPPLGESIRKEVVTAFQRDIANGWKGQAKLGLHLVHPQSGPLTLKIETNPELHKIPDGYALFTYQSTDQDDKPFSELLLLNKESIVNQSHVKHAQELYGPYEGEITVELNDQGGELMLSTTEKMQLGKDRIAVVLNGKVLSAPTVQAKLSSRFQITGLNDAQEAQELAAALLAPLTLQKLSIKSIHPPLAK